MTNPDDEGAGRNGSGSARGLGGAKVPDVEPADMHILLGPRDRRRFARWGDRGHSDPTLIAGRPRIVYLHVVALCLAAGADIGAFYQIVELVLREQGPFLVLIVVLGFTATVLYVAHACGVLFRDRRAGAGWVGRIMPFVCVLIWLGLGVAALEVRLHVLATSSVQVQIGLGATQPASGSSASTRYEAAILFFALYVATGLVAGVGAYLSHNPLRDSYAAATRAYGRASEQLAATAFQAGAAEARCSAYRAELDAAAQTLQYEIHARMALAEKLKQFARVLVAQRLKDPAITDAIFTDDWRPYEPPHHSDSN
jgi:hypothetical protein